MGRHQSEGIVKNPISRRALLTGGPLALGACGTMDGAYFGKTDPPSSQRLVYLINEPDSLDPAKVTGGDESFIVPALFEGLTNFHPVTAQPMAALATHYEVNRDFTRFTFYLRGHPRPGGVKLANTDTLRDEHRLGIVTQDFSRGHRAPPDPLPARWTDGTLITAYDFVYSWRRLIDPETAAPQYAYLLFYVRSAEAINTGQLPSETLGVRALDEFAFEIELRSPTTFFLQLTSKAALATVPRQAIEAARLRGAESSWTEPAHMITSGAFTLQERHPYDRIVLQKNSRYYESALVALDGITFLPVSDATTGLNLYKMGEAHAMPGDRVPPLFTSAVQRKKDAYAARAFYHIHPVFNTTRLPFSNVVIRYALNMATEKRELAAVFGEGRNPATTFVPPFESYRPPASVLVPIGERVYDVLSYDPVAARDLLARAGYANGLTPDHRQLTFEFRIPQVPFSRPIAEILQQQWRINLNIAVHVVIQELKAYIPAIHSGQFDMAMNGGGADYADPNTYLNLFQTGGDFTSVWSDAAYDAMLKTANSTADPAVRMKELAGCEEYLLRAMPLLPLLFYGFAGFQKPYVRGLSTNLLDAHPFKYAWIDTNWKPERS
jgi:ABC-type oligopeptide transport system substrate-binding subunit